MARVDGLRWHVRHAAVAEQPKTKVDLDLDLDLDADADAYVDVIFCFNTLLILFRLR